MEKEFLQVSVKPRQKEGSFLDALRQSYEKCKKNEPLEENRLKQKLEKWLIEKGRILDSPKNEQFLNPFDIGDVVYYHMCEISGHSWIEFSDSDQVKGVIHDNRSDINTYIAEFIPESFEIFGSLFSIFDSEYAILWDNVADIHLVKLFTPFFEPKNTNKEIFSDHQMRQRPPMGVVLGKQNLMTPYQVSQLNELWFNDRKDADNMQIDDVSNILNSIKSHIRSSSSLLYSFTPEYYEDAYNCVTWAIEVFEKLKNGWFQSIHKLANMSNCPEYCRNESSIIHQGTVWCFYCILKSSKWQISKN